MIQARNSGNSGMRCCDPRTLVFVFGLSLLTGSVGCVSLAANLINAIHGNDRPADYEGLQEQRVAILVSSDDGISTDSTSSLLSSYLQALLQSNVDDIDVVRGSDVDDWLENHGDSELDYAEIGRGVKADRLVAIDVSNLKLRNGATLYRGQCDLNVAVYDKRGKILYRKEIPEFAFPQLGGTPTTDSSETKFRSAFLTLVAQEVATLFYPSDPTLMVARDATASRF